MPHLTTSDGTRLYYQDWGTGRPVVLLGTAMLDSRMWEFQAPFLAGQGLRCIAYDRRGCGRSDVPWTGYDYDTLADDLADLADHLDLRDAVLVGYAIGGGEAVRHLSRYGTERFSRLALVASTTPLMARTDDHPEGLDPAVLDEMTAAIRHDRAQWLGQLTGPFFGGARPAPDAEAGTASGTGIPTGRAVSPELADWFMNTALSTSPRAGTELYRTLFHTDQRAEATALTLPTLIIHGSGDLAAPYDLCARRTAALIPGSTLVCYANAPHGLFASHADRLNQDLLAFAKE